MALSTTTRTGTLAQRLLPAAGPLAHPLLRDGLLVLAGSLLMAICARISFPIPGTTVPVTMQTFAVLLLGALYGPKLGAITMLAYLAQGLMGLPVFAYGFSAWTPSPAAGVPVILGPTAGYLWSFPLAAGLVGWLANRGWDRQVQSAVPAMLLGNLVILSFGFGWLAIASYLLSGSLNVGALVLAAVVPFLPGDLFKLMLAALSLPGAWKLLGRERG